MGVDIQTYRARIGTYRHYRCSGAIDSCRNFRDIDVAIKVSNDLKTVGCVLFIGVLLMIAGVEPNPGPREKDSASYQSDEVADIAKGTENNVDDTVPKLNHSAKSTRIKISGLMENMNKQMLEMFFETEERNGGSKVKTIDLDSQGKCAFVEFEQETGVDWMMTKIPMSIFGKEVHIEKMGSDTLTEEPTKIKLSRVSVDMNRAMLKRFFENAIDFVGKVVEVTVNSKESSAIITFDTSAAVYEIMNKRPITILGFKIDVDVYRDKIYPETEHGERGVQEPESLQTIGNKKYSESEHAERGVQGQESLQTTGNKKYSESEYAEKGVQGPESLQTTGTHFVACAEKEPDGTNSVARAETELDGETIASKPDSIGRQMNRVETSSQINDERDKIDSESEHAKRGVQVPESLQTTGTNSVARAETEPDGETIASKPDSIGRQTKRVETSSQINDEQVKIDSESKHAERGVQEPESLQTTGTNSAACAEKEPDGSGSCHSDEVAEVVNGAHNNAEDSHVDIPCIRIDGLLEHVNKEMLEMFFKSEERKGGGKVKSIEIDRKRKFATVLFDEKTAVDAFMQRNPKTILGIDVTVKVLGVDTKETTLIKISKLPATINKEMLLMFFENMMESDEKVVDVTVNAEDSHAIVEFDNSAAVHRVLDQKPLTIFGFEVDVDTFVPGMASVLQPLDIPRIRISGLKENTNKEMLAMYFELEYRNGEGKVKNIDIDKKRKLAIIEFEEKAGAEAFLLRNPKSILGMDVTVEVIETTSDKSRAKSTRIKITGLPENLNKEMLEMFFKTEERKGGGKVNNIFIDGKNRCALIEFKDETGVEWIMKKAPISIFGVEVGIETLDDIDEPKKIQITNLPVSINKEMLKMFFDNKAEFGGKIIDISIKSEENIVIVEFDDSTAVYRIMEERPLTILGFNVDIDVFGDKVTSQTEHAESGIQRAASFQTTENGRTRFGEKEHDAAQEYGDKVTSQTEHAESGIQAAASLQTTETGRTRFCEKVQDSPQEYESAVANNADSNPFESGLKRPDSSKSRASTETEGQIFYQILKKLGLTDKYPGKISMRDIIAVDPNESIEKVNEKISLTDIPWLVLKRLMCAHSESRDITVSEEENTENSLNSEDLLTVFSEIPDVNQDISPLDIFTVVFQCCDPVMKQIFVQKLYLCKLAVPFLYRYWETNKKQTPILSVWPLRSLAIESKQKSADKNEVQGRESDVLDLQTKVFAFGRLGRPRYSKSKLINSLLLSQGCKTFFNIDCPSGMTPRKLSNGQVELFWLPTIDEKKDRFQDPMTFLNLRGDLVEDYSKDLLFFISQFIDSIVIIIDLDTVLKHTEMVKDVLLQFSSVILIIANPLDHDAVKELQRFQNEVKSSKSKFSLLILSTHKGTVEQNVVDMLSNITKIISTTLKTNNTMSFEERLLSAKLATIKTDEEEEVCQKGKLNASKLIKQMKALGEPSSWKQHLTPVHGTFSKHLGKLFKERERERDFTKGLKIDEKIKTVRQHQITSITEPVKFFLDILIKNNSSALVLRYFLCWLHFFIEREKRKILPQLMHANRSAWEKLKALKSAEKLIKEDIEKQETVITGLEEKIDEASFAVQHFFREIGHIHEAILELKEDTNKLGFPNIHQTSSVIGRLVADGHPFELIDGESFYMPYRWIKTVIKKVDQCIESSKVMTLGVLGLQSSGKSTLLNTMFGSQFSSRAGRCTRGIHVQLIPAHIGTTSSVFSYVLIVDTEGLRSPELSNVQHEHDNELATVITGVGDITMLNIMGENTSEIRDILQVIVHAFLRLKMTNEKLDIRKSCAFIHQNVTDTSASENMISGLTKLMQTLDEMTKESAKSEGIHDIKSFNQVIEFDITSQVWYLKNLWQGNPPMARVNNEYSESVVDIKSKILKKALTMKDKCYKSLNDIVEQAHSLWKGVLNEDFVFSFRNSLEIKAYMQMESVVVAELWRLESLIQDKLIQMSQNRFASCDQKENLRNVADKIISELGRFLSHERTKTEEIIQRYFDENKYKDIIIQWENNQHVRVTFLCEKLQQVIKMHVEKCQVKRSLQILTVTCRGKHEEELRKRSIDVANAHKGQKLSSKKIDELFDDIWKEFVNKVDTSTSSEKHTMKMQDIFMTCLESIFNQKHALLKKVLNDTNSLAPLSKAKPLTKSLFETGIDKTDVGCTWYQKGKMIFGIADSDSMKYVGDRVNKIFESVDRKITELCQVNDEVTEMSVVKLMHELDSITENMLTGDGKYTFKATFYVKLYVHISRYAHPIFDNHNEKYFKTQGTAILLEQYRVQQKISFVSHLRCREIEELIAELLSNVIESFAEEWTSQTLPNKVADKLQSFLPKVKNRVIIEVCTDLLEKGNFKNFNRYIVDPYGYASSWITKEANRYLDDSKFQVIANTSMSLLDLLFSNVTRCVNEIHEEYKRKPPPSIDTWIESFQNTLESADVSIPSESFRNVRHEQSSRIQNVGHFTNTLLGYLSNSEKKLASKFKSQKSYTIKWAGFNPISRLIEKIWGCQEQCVFCGEPCAKDQNHDGSKHYSIQHRPSCCRGTYMISTNLAALESCPFKVQSDVKHACNVFKYVCNNGKQENCGETHYYKDFKKYLPNWDIPPSSNMHELSEYWMWFVATYKDQLKEHYKYQIDHIPPSWSTITKSAAKESLHNVYSAC